MDAMSLKDFKITFQLDSPHPNLRTAAAADLFSNYKVTEHQGFRATDSV